MPLDPTMLSSLTSTAPGAIGSMPTFADFSSLATNWMNQKYSRRMYDRQLSDTRALRDEANQYNSPSAQMQRFKEAGLNPNLIYGQGNAGNTTALPAPSGGHVDFKSSQGSRPPDNAMASLLGAADLKIKQAQADNLRVENSVMLQDAALRKLQVERGGFDLDLEREARPFTLGTRRSTSERGQFDLDFLRDTRDYSADAIREHVRQMSTQTDLSINRDAREAVALSTTVDEAIERMAKSRSDRATSSLERAKIAQEVRLLKDDKQLREWEVKLSQMNLTPHDGMWNRIIGSYLSDHFSEGNYGRFPSARTPVLPRGYTPLSHPTNH